MIEVYLEEDRVTFLCNTLRFVVDEELFDISPQQMEIVNRLGYLNINAVIDDVPWKAPSETPDHIINDFKIGREYAGEELSAHPKENMVVITPVSNVVFQYKKGTWMWGDKEVMLFSRDEYKVISQ